MKKIITIVATLILAFILIGCNNKNSSKIEFKLNNIENFSDSIKFEVELNDPENEIGEDIDIKINIYKKNGTQSLKEKVFKKADLLEESIFSFTGLESDILYTIVAKTTINNKSVILLTVDKNTEAAKGKNEVDIETVEDFINIKNDPTAVYYLKADLDFTNYDKTINNYIVSSFDGKLYGNNHTISNLEIANGTSYTGVFGTLSSNAVVKDLVLDNVSVEVKTAGATRLVGILFGRAINNSTVVDNITILNSNLKITLNSESKNHDVGLLGGRSAANISNIYIDENTQLDVTILKTLEPRIGGVIGKINDKGAILEKVEVNATVNVEVDQIVADPEDPEEVRKKSTNGLKGKDVFIYVGGVVGNAWQLKIENIISRTTLNLNDLNFNIDEVNETTLGKVDKANRYITFRVGGVSGHLGNTKLENAIYEGDINIGEIKLDNRDNDIYDETTNDVIDNKLTYNYETILEVGSIIGKFGMSNNNLVNVLRIDGEVNIAVQSVSIEIFNQTLLGSISNNFKYNETNNFGYIGNLPAAELVRDINSFDELFSEDSWVYTTYNK